jgi:hypothetical protein
MSQGTPSPREVAKESASPSPLLTTDEIQTQEAKAVASLPPSDQEAVERSAGEGMVATPVEAATVPTHTVTGSAGLETTDGLPIVTVVVDLVVSPPTYSGTMTVPQEDEGMKVPGSYRLRLAGGESLAIKVTERVGEMYTIEGTDVPSQTA